MSVLQKLRSVTRIFTSEWNGAKGCLWVHQSISQKELVICLSVWRSTKNPKFVSYSMHFFFSLRCMVTVLLSWGCQQSTIDCLKQQMWFFLTVVRVRSLRSWCQYGQFPLKALSYWLAGGCFLTGSSPSGWGWGGGLEVGDRRRERT